MYLQPLLYFVLKRAVLFLASDLICQDSAPDETLVPKICPFLSPPPRRVERAGSDRCLILHLLLSDGVVDTERQAKRRPPKGSATGENCLD